MNPAVQLFYVDSGVRLLQKVHQGKDAALNGGLQSTWVTHACHVPNTTASLHRKSIYLPLFVIKAS
jgi:hypothetical protein